MDGEAGGCRRGWKPNLEESRERRSIDSPRNLDVSSQIHNKTNDRPEIDSKHNVIKGSFFIIQSQFIFN